MRLASLPVIAMLCLSARAEGQRIEPFPDVLLEGTDTLYQYLVRGVDTVYLGMVTDEVSFRTIGGRRVVHRVYTAENRLTGPSRDTIIDDAVTLAPVRSASYSRRAIEIVEFRDGRALGWVRQSTGDSIRIDVALSGQVFSSASFDLVIRASEIDESWRVTVPALVPSSRVVVPMMARGVDEENFDEDGTECWKVEAEFMGMPVTFWVERDSRLICRQEMRPQAGMSLLFTRRPPAAARRDATR